MCTEPGNAGSAGPCCRHSHPRAQGPVTVPPSCLPVPPSLPSVRLHRSLCPRLQGVHHRQGHPDTPGLREGLRAARWGGYHADSTEHSKRPGTAPSLSPGSGCRTSSMEGCLWTSCTLPGQHHPTRATRPQFQACTCVGAEHTLVSRAGSWGNPKGLQEEGRAHGPGARGAQGVSSATLSPGGEAEQPPWCSPRCWGHCSLFLPCRRRCDGSSGTQCSSGGSWGLQAPETAAVTPTSPPQGCGCCEPCCPQAEPAVPTLLPTTAAGQALAAAPLVHVGQAAGTQADPLPSPPPPFPGHCGTHRNKHSQGLCIWHSPHGFSALCMGCIGPGV